MAAQAAEAIPLPLDELAAEPRRRWARRLARVARRNPVGALAAVIVAVFLFLGVFGPYLAPSDPREIDTSQQLEAPSWEHPFGTNKLGQDVLSRILAGARISFLIGLMSVGIGFSSGAALGIVSGYFGRWVDYLIQRSGEAWAAFPQIILYLAFIAAFGQGLKTIAIAITVGALFGGSRVLRAVALVTRHQDYVEAARALGATELRILLRHVVPNVMPLVIVGASSVFAVSVLAEAAISFLGLGVAPGTPSWGIDISGESQALARTGKWWLVAFPGIAISLVVLGFNLLGDTLRDILDPRLRGAR
ncbi:MAG TPA: ABC transporter permease [Dehalococcoidia bacterium]|nr:ABC transporter permease [Dehalococcoidia bacterium]